MTKTKTSSKRGSGAKTAGKSTAAAAKVPRPFTGGIKPGGNIEAFIALSDAEKAKVAARYDAGAVPESELSPLTPAEREAWEATAKKLRRSHRERAKANRGGRPVVGDGAKAVLVTIERRLLSEADAFAKANGMKRTQMVAAGLRLVMANGVSAAGR